MKVWITSAVSVNENCMFDEHDVYETAYSSSLRISVPRIMRAEDSRLLECDAVLLGE